MDLKSGMHCTREKLEFHNFDVVIPTTTNFDFPPDDHAKQMWFHCLGLYVVHGWSEMQSSRLRDPPLTATESEGKSTQPTAHLYHHPCRCCTRRREGTGCNRWTWSSFEGGRSLGCWGTIKKNYFLRQFWLEKWLEITSLRPYTDKNEQLHM